MNCCAVSVRVALYVTLVLVLTIINGPGIGCITAGPAGGSLPRSLTQLSVTRSERQAQRLRPQPPSPRPPIRPMAPKAPSMGKERFSMRFIMDLLARRMRQGAGELSHSAQTIQRESNRLGRSFRFTVNGDM